MDRLGGLLPIMLDDPPLWAVPLLVIATQVIELGAFGLLHLLLALLGMEDGQTTYCIEDFTFQCTYLVPVEE